MEFREGVNLLVGHWLVIRRGHCLDIHVQDVPIFYLGSD
jgi:hypothetical protein